jgi:hypothetical protein
MSPFGKLVTTSIALVTGTALLTGVTTAYMMRPAGPVEPTTAAYAATPAPHTSVAPRRLSAVASRPALATPRATPVAVTPSDCASGGDRAWRIAKPGVLGGLLGAGLGAAGGAIANGGSGAGKGAMIGGLAGAAVGAGYGAYKTKNECGTILGGQGFSGSSTAPDPAGRGPAIQTALRSSSANDIAIYDAR